TEQPRFKPATCNFKLGHWGSEQANTRLPEESRAQYERPIRRTVPGFGEGVVKAAREHLHLRSATEAQRPSPLNQLDAAIAALEPAQRNRSPRLRECLFFLFLRKHGLSPRQNGAGFHNQRIFLCFHRAGFRHAPAHETDLSVNSIHWFSDRRAHPC